MPSVVFAADYIKEGGIPAKCRNRHESYSNTDAAGHSDKRCRGADHRLSSDVYCSTAREGGLSARRNKRRVRRCRYINATSACVRSTHQLKRRLDLPPSLGLFALAPLFQGASLLSGLDNGFVAVGIEQLAGVVVDVDFLHSHGIMLLFHRAAATADGTAHAGTSEPFPK